MKFESFNRRAHDEDRVEASRQRASVTNRHSPFAVPHVLGSVGAEVEQGCAFAWFSRGLRYMPDSEIVHLLDDAARGLDI